ncbi:GNAT family N-acetyltransferase [Ruegeria sp. HKCCD8929]|uniref:GNAT family N-acetyltransferase n=1 Tax=Ruegeria sp. HKCCD8929 TaxID=2683006 RepID=UPI0014896355|nr:GNAT family N-acetyltransferase [Ruegeria sp. HKCCD8929]
MSWRRAQDADVPGIERFLRARLQSSMFLLANLQNHGLTGDAPHAMTIWALGDEPRGVFGISRQGMVLLQCPDCGEADLRAATALIADREVTGIIGEAAQARRLMALAGWEHRAAKLNKDEPAFALDLARLVIPESSDTELVPLADVDRSIPVAWRAAYHAEVLGAHPDESRQLAEQDVSAYIERGSHRVLLADGQPVCMTGFNASLPDVVQIGGVYTPPDLRGHGYARRAVALHLDEARQTGVTRAILFAANAPAVRAYQAIGFERAGSLALILFDMQTEVTA